MISENEWEGFAKKLTSDIEKEAKEGSYSKTLEERENEKCEAIKDDSRRLREAESELRNKEGK